MFFLHSGFKQVQSYCGKKEAPRVDSLLQVKPIKTGQCSGSSGSQVKERFYTPTSLTFVVELCQKNK